jgi:ABC-type amino acid transport substrate-binding protein
VRSPACLPPSTRSSGSRGRLRFLAGSSLCLALSLAGGLAVTPASAQGDALSLGSDRWPPFTDEPGRARFAVELVDEALDRAGIDASTAIIDWEAVLPGLRSGKLDGSAALWRSAEREQFLLFSEPYLENRLVLVGRKGADVSATSLADLADKRLAVVGGYAYGEQLEEDRAPELVRRESDEASLQTLLEGRADYMLVDDLVIQYILENHADDAKRWLEIGSRPLLVRPLHFAVRRDLPEAEVLVSRFDREIRGMIADGTYNRILQVSWIRADVDGDGRAELVPRGDRLGAMPPTSSYEVEVTVRAKADPTATGEARFYIGGEVYENWDAVPQRYKRLDPLEVDPTQSSATLFRFEF